MLSRSTLALSAFALLASGGVMAGVGPDDMNKRGGRGDGRDDRDSFNLRINIGGSAHGHHGPVSAPRPPVFHPAPVIVDAAPHTLDIQAYQAGDTVMVLARGDNTTGGFATSLERIVDGRFDGVVNLVLRNIGPAHSHHAQVCVPFAVSGGFETRERVNEINITVGGVQRCIPVQRIDQMRRAN